MTPVIADQNTQRHTWMDKPSAMQLRGNACAIENVMMAVRELSGE
jgi:hypothetical protein